MAQAGVFAPGQTEDSQKKYFSDQLLTALTLLFSLISQYAVDVVKDPALARRVVALWQTPDLWNAATEAYDRCFKQGLEGLAAR